MPDNGRPFNLVCFISDSVIAPIFLLIFSSFLKVFTGYTTLNWQMFFFPLLYLNTILCCLASWLCYKIISQLAFSYNDSSLIERRAHQLVSQSQIISPGNMLMSNTVQIEQIIVGNICVYTYAYMYVIIINENRL